MKIRQALVVLTGIMGLLASPASKAQLTFSWYSGDLAASATFSTLSENRLQVVLTNTSTADVLVPTDVLTAVFFNIAGNPTLTRTSALLSAGSSVVYDSAPAGGVVGGEWAYNTGLVGAPLGSNQGISSTGVNLFGPGDRFPGGNLAGPNSPNGLQYGILSAGDLSGTGNGGITGSEGLIRNSVTFTLGGWTGQLADINNVSFLYGTSLAPIPEPEIYAMMLAGLGLMGFVANRRRRGGAVA